MNLLTYLLHGLRLTELPIILCKIGENCDSKFFKIGIFIFMVVRLIIIFFSILDSDLKNPNLNLHFNVDSCL